MLVELTASVSSHPVAVLTKGKIPRLNLAPEVEASLIIVTGAGRHGESQASMRLSQGNMRTLLRWGTGGEPALSVLGVAKRRVQGGGMG